MKEYIEDLKEIREIMNRSTRFISLSGLSGVSTGIIALAGSYLAYQTIFKEQDYLVYNAVDISKEIIGYLLFIAIGTLILSIASAIFFTSRKTRKQKQNVWDQQTKRLLINLSIPLIAGGLLCLMLIFEGFLGIVPALTLIFYGLALVNGSKYTLYEIRNLGLIEIMLGLIAFQFIDYGLLFWAFGFGVIQIVYGLIIQWKYKL
jgi:flagellar biosynthesis component FlhA